MNTLSYRTLLLALALAASASLSACVPYHFTDAPAVAGQVVSSATDRPVAGATVSMTANNRSVRTHTDQVGGFRLPSIGHWGVIAYPSDGVLDGSGNLHVEAAGYRAYVEESSYAGHEVLRMRTEPESKHIRIVLTPDA